MAWNEPGSNNRDPWNQNGGGNGGNRGGPGGGGNQGPPDLDEIIKRFKARLGGKGPRGPRGPAGAAAQMPKLPGGAVGIALGLIGLLWVASGFYTIDEQERGVVLRFGAYTVTTEPGLRWHLPWPVEKVEKVQFTKVQSVSQRAVMLTQDENIIDVELSVQYRVSSAYDFVMNVVDPKLTLEQATKAVVREVVGSSPMDFVLNEGRQAVADRAKISLQERLDEYKTGLIVTEINLNQVQPPEAVQAAFADVIKAREDLERQKNEAQAYANDRLPKARGAAARDIAEATAYKDQIVAKAQGDAARFTSLVSEYRKAPQVTRERLYLDTMSEVYRRSSKVVIDVEKGSPMIYLPLDQLMKSMPKTATPATSDMPTSSSPPATGSGDASRSRSR